MKYLIIGFLIFFIFPNNTIANCNFRSFGSDFNVDSFTCASIDGCGRIISSEIKDSLSNSYFNSIIAKMPFMAIDNAIIAAKKEITNYSSIDSIISLRIVITNFSHDNISSPTLFYIVASKTNGRIFYLSTKDSRKTMLLDNLSLKIIFDFIESNFNVFIDANEDDNHSLYFLLEYIGNSNNKSKIIRGALLNTIMLPQCQNINYTEEEFKIQLVTKAYNDFYILLRNLTSQMRCQN